MTTVTLGTTLTNPAGLNEQQLREALERANQDLICRDLEVAQLRHQLYEHSLVMSQICNAVLQRNAPTLNAILSQLATSYKDQQAAIAARKVH